MVTNPPLSKCPFSVSDIKYIGMLQNALRTNKVSPEWKKRTLHKNINVLSRNFLNPFFFFVLLQSFKEKLHTFHSFPRTSRWITRPLRLCKICRNDLWLWYPFLLVWRTRRKILVHLSLLQGSFTNVRWNVYSSHQNIKLDSLLELWIWQFWHELFFTYDECIFLNQ